jgi:hypothetical protein
MVGCGTPAGPGRRSSSSNSTACVGGGVGGGVGEALRGELARPRWEADGGRWWTGPVRLGRPGRVSGIFRLGVMGVHGGQDTSARPTAQPTGPWRGVRWGCVLGHAARAVAVPPAQRPRGWGRRCVGIGRCVAPLPRARRRPPSAVRVRLGRPGGTGFQGFTTTKSCSPGVGPSASEQGVPAGCSQTARPTKCPMRADPLSARVKEACFTLRDWEWEVESNQVETAISIPQKAGPSRKRPEGPKPRNGCASRLGRSCRLQPGHGWPGHPTGVT